METITSRVFRRPAVVGSALALGLVVTLPAMDMSNEELQAATQAAIVQPETLNSTATLSSAVADAQAQLDAQRAAEAAAAEAARLAAEEEARRANTPTLPTSNFQLTARFGQAGGWSRGYHTGLDFAAPSGTPVVAALHGTVVDAGWNGAYGNQITIRHADGTQTTYAHLSSINVSVGQSVGTGQRIGAVGSTGNSTGPHLHFEVITPGGQFINPATWLGM